MPAIIQSVQADVVQISALSVRDSEERGYAVLSFITTKDGHRTEAVDQSIHGSHDLLAQIVSALPIGPNPWACCNDARITGRRAIDFIRYFRRYDAERHTAETLLDLMDQGEPPALNNEAERLRRRIEEELLGAATHYQDVAEHGASEGERQKAPLQADDYQHAAKMARETP